MLLRWIGVLACAAILLAVMPSASFDLSLLAVGKPAIGLDHAVGRPLVIVAFASWCVGCVEELPQVLADYRRFKDRVDFVGVDYLDNPNAGEALIKKYTIPFPVVQSMPNDNALPPANPNEQLPVDSIHITGLTPQALPKVVATLEGKLPASILTVLKTVAAYCKVHTNTQCIAYGNAHNVQLAPTPPPVEPTSSASADQRTTYVNLPHLFVIDSHGIVRADVGGYNSGTNAIAVQLAKLGIN